MEYREGKEKARQKAIDWQIGGGDFSYSYEGLLMVQAYFYKLGKRYGLLREFRKNGIPC